MKPVWQQLNDQQRLLFLSFIAKDPSDDEWITRESVAETNSIPIKRTRSVGPGTDAVNITANTLGPDLTNSDVEDDIIPQDFHYRPLAPSRLQTVSLDPTIDIDAQDMRGIYGMLRRFLLIAYEVFNADAEITASYLGQEYETVLPRTERRALLKERFELDCCCSACDVAPDRIQSSDDNLAKYRRIYHRRYPGSDNENGLDIKAYAARPGALDEIERAIRILKHEKLDIVVR
ncbi:hypothetical protein Q5752_006256 [Cryptotrichosporon argae]